MKTLTLKIEDSAVDNVMWFLEQLKDVVKIETQQTYKQTSESNLHDDPLAKELKKRIQAIDDGSEIVTPYSDGMDSMMERIRLKCASA